MGIAAAVVFDVADVPSVGGDGEPPAGEAVDDGKIRSSMFIGSSSVLYCGPDKSKDLRNLAIPDGALEFCWFRLTSKGQSRPGTACAKALLRCNTYRACSRSLRFRLMAIIRHVRFSIRSWLGNCVLVLLYSFHICVASGSCFCISSGGLRSALAASSRQSGKKASRRSSLRGSWFLNEVSSLPRVRWEAMVFDAGGC